MPIKPLPYKAICEECGTSKIVSPKDDVISIEYVMPVCPKCGKYMARGENPDNLDYKTQKWKNIIDKWLKNIFK